MLMVADVLSRTDDLLLDADRVRWTTAERIRWMNEAMAAILIRKPSAFARHVVMTLAEGTRQSISGAILLDVVRNIDANGNPGKSIRRTDRQLLDDTDLNWHTGKKKTVVKNYTFDDRAPKVFYNYPPVVAGTRVEILQAELPAAVAEDNVSGSYDINGEYLEPVVNYVVYRCNSKDSEYASPATAAAFYQAFVSGLGEKQQADTAASPNQPTNSV